MGLPIAAPASAQGGDWKHGLSLFGDLKYPAGFSKFDYVIRLRRKAVAYA